MKNINLVELGKYNDKSQFKKVSEYVYQNLSDGRYKLAISCELEDGEDSQYPLEDILDKYYVNCTDYFEEKDNGEIRSLAFELEGSLGVDEEDFHNITEISKIIGKRVYNKEENGRIKLVIE